jgi:hypothetical protein
LCNRGNGRGSIPIMDVAENDCEIAPCAVAFQKVTQPKTPLLAGEGFSCLVTNL